tara:strand:+ start:201 stop:683 length:483 start_codon:yes stop_codon:yes gene_type:complete
MSPYVFPGVFSIKLEHMTNEQKITTIVSNVCNFFSIPVKDFNKKSRKRKYIETRCAAFWLMREYTTMSYMEIGKTFHKDHSTIIHAVRNAYEWQKTDENFKESLDRVHSIFEPQINYIEQENSIDNDEEERKNRDNQRTQTSLEKVLSRIEQEEKERTSL